MKKILLKTVIAVLVMTGIGSAAFSPSHAVTNYSIFDVGTLLLFLELVRPVFSE